MDYESFMAGLPIELNNQQTEAVRTVNGPVLLLAVPGSGKTTVLVARLGYMIFCCGIDPSDILTLTYTVAAANDMRARFGRFFGAELGSRLEFRTINSVCAGVISEYGRRIGKTAFELESDEKVLIGIISELYRKCENDFPAESDIKDIRTQITYIKNMMLSDSEIMDLEKDRNIHLLDIYKAYCQELRRRMRMDYDDQMVYACRLLKGSPQLLAYYRDRYHYICVDEAQDTSKIQHEIIAMLASETENLFMVGDEDQSIYAFRAAYPDALLSFEKDHPNARVLLMEENFRSNASIVSAADRFIQKNTLRHEKHMKAARGKGPDIREITLKSRGSQYSYLLKIAQDCTRQTAVLYRDNESSIPLVDLLERNNVPYRIRNAELSFFTHRVVCDIRNIMRFACDMGNADLFEQIYYKLSSYLNRQCALKACSISREHHIPVFAAIQYLPDIKPLTRKSLRALETHFSNMRYEGPQKALSRIVSYMGYGEYMERAGLKTDKVMILKNIAGRESTIDSFLERLDDLKDIIQNASYDMSCPFILSTIHASKGLEYDNVFMIDVQDGLFPEELPSDNKRTCREEMEVYEEERRLFYVGITRARNNLFLLRTQEPSSFIDQLLDKNNVKEDKARRSSGKSKISVKQDTYRQKPVMNEPDYNAFINSLAAGTAVTHKKCGKGTIMAVNSEKVTIMFGDGKKTFSLRVLYQKDLLKKDR